MNRLGGTADQSPTASMTGRYSKAANIGSFVAGPLRYPMPSAVYLANLKVLTKCSFRAPETRSPSQHEG
jgi:hypothetical protein